MITLILILSYAIMTVGVASVLRFGYRFYKGMRDTFVKAKLAKMSAFEQLDYLEREAKHTWKVLRRWQWVAEKLKFATLAIVVSQRMEYVDGALKVIEEAKAAERRPKLPNVVSFTRKPVPLNLTSATVH